MASMTVRVKFVLAEDIRVVRLQALNAEELGRAVREVFGATLPAGFVLKYRDGEGDLCTLAASTFADFCSLHEGKPMARIEVVPQASTAPSPTSSSRSAGASQDAEMSPGADALPRQPQRCHPQFQQHQYQQQTHAAPGLGPIFGLPLQLAGLLPRLCSGLLSDDAFADLFVSFAPEILAHLDQAWLDELARGHKEAIMPLLMALREGIEPFPQFQEARTALDHLLQADQVDGLGAALHSLLSAMCSLPREEQRAVAAVIIGGLAGRLSQIAPLLRATVLPAAAGAAGEAETPVHYRITCDGCDRSPIVGPRFKCTTCPDFDLCHTCHANRENLHNPWHTFQMITAPVHGLHHCHRGRHWSRRCGGGKGHKGKGKGKWECGRETSSSSTGLSSSSSSDHHHSSRMERHQWRKARKEAKRRLKLQIKAAKQAFKQEKKAWKQQRKVWKKECKQYHGTWDNQADAGWAAYDAKDAPTPPVPAPVVDTPSPLQVLAEMGFENIEQNAQLLDLMGNNLQKVIELLTSGSGPRDECAAMQC